MHQYCQRADSVLFQSAYIYMGTAGKKVDEQNLLVGKYNDIFVQEYMAEGVPVDLVEFSDNRPVLDMLLSRPLGLLALLDEESRFPRATDRSFIGK